MEAKPGLVLMSGSLVEAVSLLEWSSWVRGWKGLDAERVLRECFMAARKVTGVWQHEDTNEPTLP